MASVSPSTKRLGIFALLGDLNVAERNCPMLRTDRCRRQGTTRAENLRDRAKHSSCDSAQSTTKAKKQNTTTLENAEPCQAVNAFFIEALKFSSVMTSASWPVGMHDIEADRIEVPYASVH